MDGGIGKNPVAPDETTRRLIEKLRRELGPRICGYLNEPSIIEIMLNPDGSLWIDRLGGDMEQVGFMDAVQAEALMGTVAAALRTPLLASGKWPRLPLIVYTARADRIASSWIECAKSVRERRGDACSDSIARWISSRWRGDGACSVWS
jgi:hypothetical protein